VELVSAGLDPAPPVVARWLRLVEGGEYEGGELEEMLIEDAVFRSPAVFTPQRGRAVTAAYLRAAARMFAGTDFHYLETWYAPDSAVLHFAAQVDGLSVEGIDMIHWNRDGQITSFTVMIRPFKALQGVIAKMAELLAAP
jgi:hypothetical protein